MIIKRLLTLPRRQSLFLFGARGVGKSNLLETKLDFARVLFLNLLDPAEEARFSATPMN